MQRPMQSRIEQKINRENYNFPRSLPSTMPTPIFHNHELYTFDQNATNVREIQRPVLTKTRNNHNNNPSSLQNQQRSTSRQMPTKVQVSHRPQNEFYFPLPNQQPNKPYSRPEVKTKPLPPNQTKQARQFIGYQDRDIFSMPEPVQNFKFKDNNMNYRLQNYHSLNGTFKDKEINKFYDRHPVNSRRDMCEEIRNDDKEKFIRIQGGPLNNIVDNKGSTTRSKRLIVNNYVPIARNMAVPPEAIP